MKLFLKNLVSPQTVTISGTEDWLKPLYQSFPAPKGQSAPQLNGELQAKQVAEGTSAQITGNLKYAPYVDCSRCGKALHTSLDIDVDASFQQEPELLHEKNVHNLSEGELDQYYFGEGNSIDIEGLINDLVNLEIPERLQCSDPATCVPSQPEDDPLWSSEAGGAAKENPFAVLANLKLGDKH